MDSSCSLDVTTAANGRAPIGVVVENRNTDELCLSSAAVELQNIMLLDRCTYILVCDLVHVFGVHTVKIIGISVYSLASFFPFFWGGNISLLTSDCLLDLPALYHYSTAFPLLLACSLLYTEVYHLLEHFMKNRPFPSSLLQFQLSICQKATDILIED